MGLETSSKRYAKALIGYGVEKDNLDILFSEFSSLIQTLEDSEDLVSFIPVSYTHLTLPTTPYV